MATENNLLLPTLNVEPCEDAAFDWVSKNGDPQFAVTNPMLFAGQWLRLSCQVSTAAEVKEAFTIYQDIGGGWSESNATTIYPNDKGNISHIWKCDRKVREIRVDPIESAGNFSVRLFSLEPITNLSAPVPSTLVDNPLDSLFSTHDGKVSDKWSSYIVEYQRLLSPYRNLPIRLFEIGVQNGGSLEIWSQYFANAEKLIGCDVNRDCAKLTFGDPRIALIVADANTDDAQQQVLSQSPNFDLIIDDGSHRSSDIVQSFARYFPHLNDGGLYVVEDLHCSYWQDYEGGIFQPHSAISFFKQLADTLNHEHWGVSRTRTELLRGFDHPRDTPLDEETLAHVHSVEFINSICVIKKAPPSENILGKRRIVGKLASVDAEILSRNDSDSLAQEQDSNYWSTRYFIAVGPIERTAKTQLLRTQLDYAQQVAELQKQFSDNEEAYQNQLSELRQRLENELRTMAERERAFTLELLREKQAHENLVHEQASQFIAREQHQRSELALVRQELQSRLDETTDRVREFQAQLQAKQVEIKEIWHKRVALLNRDLSGIRASFSWRLTAPFRRLAVSLGKNKSIAPADTLSEGGESAEQSDVATTMAYTNQHLSNSSLPKKTPTAVVETPTMNSSLPNNTAKTLEQLVSYHDEQFVQCVYQTLLNRKPDDEGMRFYLASVRAGISKLEILSQIRLSSEGKSNTIDVVGLDEAIKRHRRRQLPILGALLRIFRGSDIEGSLEQKARVIENKLHVLDAQINRGFTKLGSSLGNRKHLVGSASEQLHDENIPSSFDPIWYVQQYPDVAETCMTPYDHYLTIGRDEGRYPVFDSEWYRSEYADAAASDLPAREHYDRYGKADGRFPCFDAHWYLNAYQDVAAAGLDARTHYLLRGRAEGRYPAYNIHNGRNDYRKWIATFDTLTPQARAYMHEQCNRFGHKPLISIVMPVYNPNPDWLKEAIESVINQIYPNWELCIADDSSNDKTTRPMLERYAARDGRIKVVFRPENGHISAASNSAIEVSDGEWIALLDHDDILPEQALFWVVDAINKHPDVRMIYSDEDKINENGLRFEPYFKCDWNVDLFYSHNMFSHLGLYHASLIEKVGGLRVGFEGSQDYDLALRCSELVDTKQIHHIPRVLYHWRMHANSTASDASAKPYAAIAGVRAIDEHFARLGVNAKAESMEFCYRVHYELPECLPLVSLIIPTRNGVTLLRQCVESIFTKTTYKFYEVLIVDNGSDDPETLRYLEGLRSNDRIRVMRDNRPFNYSALNNAAVKIARGELIGLINNDIEVISPDWLTEMVSHAIRPEVGAVGARLWYANDTLQHGGVILGLGGVACHAHKNLPKWNQGYMGRAGCIQSFSAVTAACLLVRKSIYESIGGLNEVDLQVAFNDVDFCLRIREAGYRNIWTPYADLYHHESATRGTEDTPAKKARFEREIAYMCSHWETALQFDPAYSPNLTVGSEDFSYAWPPRVEKLVLSS